MFSSGTALYSRRFSAELKTRSSHHQEFSLVKARPAVAGAIDRRAVLSEADRISRSLLRIPPIGSWRVGQISRCGIHVTDTGHARDNAAGFPVDRKRKGDSCGRALRITAYESFERSRCAPDRHARSDPRLRIASTGGF